MSGRIRSIKPETHVDEDLWDADVECPGLHLFRSFTGLWCQADREGRFEWRPRVLKPAILPHWDGDFSRVLDALETRGFIVRYTIEGRSYGWIPTFKKHQYINGKEPQSKLPPAPDYLVNSVGCERVRHVSPREADTSPSRPEGEVHAPLQIPSRSLPDPEPVPDPDARDGDPTTSPEHPKPPVPAPLDAKAAAWMRDPYQAQLAFGSPESWPEVVAAYDGFRAIWPNAGKLRSRDPRAQRIVERFAEGFTIGELLAAAAGAALDDHIAGHAEFQNPLTIWRDAAQVDRFAALRKAGPAKAKPGRFAPTQTDEGFDAFANVTGGLRDHV